MSWRLPSRTGHRAPPREREDGQYILDLNDFHEVETKDGNVWEEQGTPAIDLDMSPNIDTRNVDNVESVSKVAAFEESESTSFSSLQISGVLLLVLLVISYSCALWLARRHRRRIESGTESKK